MNGLVICNTVRERYQNQIAILVITGLNVLNRRISSFRRGGDDLLGKSLDVDEFITRIKRKVHRAPKA